LVRGVSGVFFEHGHAKGGLLAPPTDPKFEKVCWFVYAHAPPAVDFIYISTGLLSDVHGYKEDSRARAACTCNWNFMNF